MKNIFISMVVLFSTAQAKPDGGDDEFEYSLGVEKTFLFGNKKNLSIANLNNEANLLELEKELLAFNNQVKMLYHQSCLEKSQRASYEKSYGDFEKLYAKKEKAYKYKEISKKELLQLKIEKADLEQKLQSLRADENISKLSLFSLIELKSSEAQLFCQDLYPMEFTQNDEQTLFTLSKEALDKQILGAKKSANLHNRSFESVDLSLGYDKEVDMKRYGVGVSLPLSFTSRANEYKKVSALHQQKALKLKKQNLLLGLYLMIFWC